MLKNYMIGVHEIEIDKLKWGAAGNSFVIGCLCLIVANMMSSHFRYLIYSIGIGRIIFSTISFYRLIKEGTYENSQGN